MKKEKIMYSVGYGILGLVLLFGAVLIWNARMTIDTQVAEAEESAKPAEIELTLIAPSNCDQCLDGNILMEEIEKQDVRILGSETFLTDSEEGLALIEAYGITRVPAILVQGQYDRENVKEVLVSLGGEEQNGVLVIEIKLPVYVDLTQNNIVGLVEATYLTDSSCLDCYDAVQHKAILENNFGMTIASEQRIDAQSSAGRALIDQYAITQIPTVLLSSQALAYERLAATWAQVGTIEEDGTFVFRNNTALGSVIYKNLETGEVVRPKTSDE